MLHLYRRDSRSGIREISWTAPDNCSGVPDNTSNFNQRLDEVDREFSNYYVLGFESNNPRREGKHRRLEIRTNFKEARIKHDNGYADPSP